jgi:hypothetical protein
MRLIGCVFLLVLAACAGDSSKEVEPKSVVPAEQEEPATAVEAEPAAPEPTEAAPTDSCVADCVAARQMQATSIEQIEADCQAKCSSDDSKSLP